MLFIIHKISQLIFQRGHHNDLFINKMYKTVFKAWLLLSEWKQIQ